MNDSANVEPRSSVGAPTESRAAPERCSEALGSAAWDPAATPGCYAISEAALREYNDLGSGFVAYIPGGRGTQRVNDCIEYTLGELTRLREAVLKLEHELAHWKAVARYNRATSLPNGPCETRRKQGDENYGL